MHRKKLAAASLLVLVALLGFFALGPEWGYFNPLGQPSPPPAATTGDLVTQANVIPQPGTVRVAATQSQDKASGSVLVKCVDVNGNPVRGVRCQLLTATSGRKWPHLWWRHVGPLDRVATTDATGVAAWHDLAPGPYRWGIACEHWGADIAPQFEKPAYTTDSQGLHYNPQTPQQLSGQFLVVENEDIQFQGVAHSARIIGSVRVTGTARLAGPITISLGRREVVKLEAGGEAGLLQFERKVKMATPGEFSIERLTPGLKLLDIDWETMDGHHFRDLRVIDVKPNQVLDLGVINGAGGSISVSADGLASDTRVALSQSGESMQDRNSVPFFDQARISQGGTITFHGLPPGDYTIELFASSGTLRETRTIGREPVSLNFAAPKTHATRLRVACDGTYKSADIAIAPISGNAIKVSLDLNYDGAQSIGTAAIEIPLCPCMATVTAKRGGRNTVVGVVLLSPRESWHSIRLDESATITGKVASKDAVFVTAGVAEFEGALWVTTIHKGGFQFEELPRNTAIWVRLMGGTKTVIMTSPTGKHVEVNLSH